MTAQPAGLDGRIIRPGGQLRFYARVRAADPRRDDFQSSSWPPSGLQ